MTLDDCNEPQPGEAVRLEAPVIHAWRYLPAQWRAAAPGVDERINGATALDVILLLRQFYPGHTIDLSAEPPEGISR